VRWDGVHGRTGRDCAQRRWLDGSGTGGRAARSPRHARRARKQPLPVAAAASFETRDATRLRAIAHRRRRPIRHVRRTHMPAVFVPCRHARMQHMGVARGIIDQKLAQPEVIAGNSGGTWFVALLAYSSRFFAAVQSPTDASGRNSIGKAYTDFMAAYATLFRPENDGGRTWEASGRLKDVLTLLDAGKLARNFGLSWLAFIHAMFAPRVARTSGVHPSAANAERSARFHRSRIALAQRLHADKLMREGAAVHSPRAPGSTRTSRASPRGMHRTQPTRSSATRARSRLRSPSTRAPFSTA